MCAWVSPMNERSDLRTWSFVSLLVGGVLIMTAGLMGSLMMSTWGWMGGMPMSGVMDAYMGEAWSQRFAWWMGLVGLATGGLVLASAYHVRQARNVYAWCVVAIVAGAFSLFAMGGYVVGAVAAIAGGALGLFEREAALPPAA